MARVRLSDIHAARERGKPRGLPSAIVRLSRIGEIANDAEAFVAKINRPIQDIEELSYMQGCIDQPLFPLTFKRIEDDGETGFQVIGRSSMIEVRTGDAQNNPEITFSMFVTKEPNADITAPDAERVVLDERKTLFPNDIIKGKFMDEKKEFMTFQTAMIAMTLSEGETAQNGQYNDWPGYGFSQQVLKCLPDSLKPPYSKDAIKGHAIEIDQYQIDEPLLPNILFRIGQVRKETVAPKLMEPVPTV